MTFKIKEHKILRISLLLIVLCFVFSNQLSLSRKNLRTNNKLIVHTFDNENKEFTISCPTGPNADCDATFKAAINHYHPVLNNNLRSNTFNAEIETKFPVNKANGEANDWQMTGLGTFIPEKGNSTALIVFGKKSKEEETHTEGQLVQKLQKDFANTAGTIYVYTRENPCSADEHGCAFSYKKYRANQELLRQAQQVPDHKYKVFFRGIGFDKRTINPILGLAEGEKINKQNEARFDRLRTFIAENSQVFNDFMLDAKNTKCKDFTVSNQALTYKTKPFANTKQLEIGNFMNCLNAFVIAKQQDQIVGTMFNAIFKSEGVEFFKI